MPTGRLVRVRKSPNDPESVSYIVAEPTAAKAVALVRLKTRAPEESVEDIGRVSEALIKALDIPSGEFVRVDKRRE
jgi:hypothetical protein